MDDVQPAPVISPWAGVVLQLPHMALLIVIVICTTYLAAAHVIPADGTVSLFSASGGFAVGGAAATATVRAGRRRSTDGG